MQNLIDGIIRAIQLLLQGDPEVVQITLLSLTVSGIATLISILIGLPLGTFLAMVQFRSRQFWISLINTGMALPPVVVGLVVSIFLWRSGPLGSLNLIYTPAAIVIAQVLISFPLAAGLTISSLQQLDPRLRVQLLGLGASKNSNDTGVVEGSAVGTCCRADRRVWQRHFGGGSFHDGWRQSQGFHPRAHHRHRA